MVRFNLIISVCLSGLFKAMQALARPVSGVCSVQLHAVKEPLHTPLPRAQTQRTHRRADVRAASGQREAMTISQSERTCARA